MSFLNKVFGAIGVVFFGASIPVAAVLGNDNGLIVLVIAIISGAACMATESLTHVPRYIANRTARGGMVEVQVSNDGAWHTVGTYEVKE